MAALMQAVVQDSQRRWLSMCPEKVHCLGAKPWVSSEKSWSKSTLLGKETRAESTTSYESDPDYGSSSLFVKESGFGSQKYCFPEGSMSESSVLRE